MSGQCRKVLVCDDSPDILDVTAMLLEEAGFDVSTQLNSRLLIAQAIKEQPDVMLIDLWMPFLTGDQLTRQIKQMPQLAHIPVIIFSAAIDGKIVAREIGAERFIEKPFDLENLVSIIHTVIN